ncbi:hypothetical protein N658DRAFT_521015 [Parathielavia hyrcaniae]|uniref:Uncharacterized protein n=1 Tax=Parathielavia hyrcaniae TaxID=113614 RepID=A0AAN6Q931_9PEZI|nr:hypothetical protein N658DRAFT_521015 [Parathielavia hyrcaniae]
MCYREYIAYQCGHRSMGVMRPCPLTTAGHNFPVCALRPDKPHYAETMCAACERQLHSRWVLIREWEHRWLHERGACGCEVIFPGLLHTPRVIGDTSATNSSPVADGNANALPERPRAIPTSAALERSNKVQQQEAPGNVQQAATSGDDDGQNVPPLFTEEVTPSGEHHVAVRLPGLYAAEWQADHRALHDAGKCPCPISFDSHAPRVPDDELAPPDREKLRRWRELEAEEDHKKGQGTTGEIDGDVDETQRRVAEIKDMFGEFDVETEESRANLPRLEQNQVVPLPQPTVPYSPAAGPPGYPYPYPVAPFNQPPPPNTGYTYPEYAQHHPHHQLHYFNPAYPTYATAATYTDTIPYGAYPWAPEPQRTPGMSWMSQGPGPFRTSGYIYHSPPTTTHEWHDPGSSSSSGAHAHAQVPVDRQLPAPPSDQVEPVAHSEFGDNNHRDQGRQVEAVHPHNTAESQQEPLSLCGLPIGAGPEGTSHVPSWQDCPLRRHASAGNLLFSDGRDGGGDGAAPPSELEGTEGVAVRQGRVGGYDKQEEENASAGGQVDGDHDHGEQNAWADAELDMPPPLPPRPHSAAT